MKNISVIIPVLNGDKYIGRCIDNIKELHNDGSYLLELIIIDNGSTDSTIQIINNQKVKFFILKDSNISGLRNYGVSKSSGEVVCFVDSDCFVDKNWIVNAIKELADDPKIGIVGRFYDVSDSPTWVEKTWHDMRKDVDGYVDFIPSGNMVIWRHIFKKVGGFDEKFDTGEDYNLCQRVRSIGYEVKNSPNVNVRHMGNPKRLIDITKKERWYGKGMFTKEKNFEISKPLLASYVFSGLFFLMILSYPISKTISILFSLGLLLTLITVAIHFSKNVKTKKTLFIIRFIPISFFYLFGRSLSLYDHYVYAIKQIVVSNSNK